MKLMHWEYNELLEHLVDRTDIWAPVPDRQNAFFRTVDGDAAMVLVGKLPTATGPYRQVDLLSMPMAWTADETDGYVFDLVTKWTSYGFRIQVADMLAKELGIETDKAQLAAIAICKMQLLPEKDPDLPGTQAVSDTFWPQEGDVGVQPPDLPEGKWHLADGGYVKLRLTGGQIAIRVSIRTPKDEGGGYMLPFDGFVRPRCGDASYAMAVLLGWPVELPEIPDVLPMAQDLPLDKEEA